MTQFDPGTTALVVVDMQRDFCHPEGALYAPGSETVVEPCARLANAARDAGVRVVYTRDVHPSEQFEGNHSYDEFDRWGEHVFEGSWGAGLCDALPVADGDHVVEKHSYDAFHETELDAWLSARGIDTLLFCGTLANVCVLHTAASAGLRDYRVVLVEDAIGALEEDHREYAADHIEWLVGERTTTEGVGFA